MDKIAFPSADHMQKTRLRSWYEVVAESQRPPIRGLWPEKDRSVNRNRREALDRLDGLCEKAEVDEGLFKNLVERELERISSLDGGSNLPPQTPPRPVGLGHLRDERTQEKTSPKQSPSHIARTSAESLSPYNTVLLTPTTSVIATGATTQAKSGASTEIMHEVGELSRKRFDDFKTDTSESLHHSESDVLLDFTRFQKPVARIIDYRHKEPTTNTVDKTISTPTTKYDSVCLPASRSSDARLMTGHSPSGSPVLPARFITPSDPAATTGCLAIPVAMIPIKDTHGVSNDKMDQESPRFEASLKRRSSSILLKAKPSMERLSRAFEEGLSKTLAVFRGTKGANGKVTLLADIQAYRAIERRPSTTTKKMSYQSLVRSVSTSKLSRPLKRGSMDSGFSWSPKTWGGEPDASTINAAQSSASSSPRTIRRRPRLHDFRLSSLSHFKPKPAVEITASISSSDHKRSDSEESWGNVSSEKNQGQSTQRAHMIMSSKALKETRAEMAQNTHRVSTHPLLKNGSAWGAMRRASSRKPSYRNTVDSVAASSSLECTSDSPNMSSRDLCDIEGKQGTQDARNEALAILEGRFMSSTRKMVDILPARKWREGKLQVRIQEIRQVKK